MARIRKTYTNSIDYVIRDQEMWLADPLPRRQRGRRLPEQLDPQWGLDAIDLPLDKKWARPAALAAAKACSAGFARLPQHQMAAAYAVPVWAVCACVRARARACLPAAADAELSFPCCRYHYTYNGTGVHVYVLDTGGCSAGCPTWAAVASSHVMRGLLMASSTAVGGPSAAAPAANAAPTPAAALSSPRAQAPPVKEPYTLPKASTTRLISSP